MNIGLRVKSLRKELKISQKALADKLNLSPSFLCDVENGRANLTVTTLIDIARELDTSVAYLVGEDTTKQKIPAELLAVSLTLSQTEQGSELLQLLSDFDSWSDTDRQELLNYLRVKKLVRQR